MNIDQVRELERIKGSERRKEVREQKYEELRKMQELKVNRALERAAAPVTKKTGKPLMLRSAPKERKKKEEGRKTEKGVRSKKSNFSLSFYLDQLVEQDQVVVSRHREDRVDA